MSEERKKRVLNDRYQLESPLGHGAMARVYRASDRVLGRTVAVKVLSGRFARDDNFVKRFRREAQAAAALNHPNIASVYDTGDEANDHYIVMEYVEGRSLGEVLRDGGTLRLDRVAGIGAAVCRALQAAHDRGLVHRDVKPGNVMLTPEDHVKVVDFGIARTADDETLTQTGAVLGTAAYLSPEQARGDPVDGRSDLYSLGCVLYEALTGRQPFTGESSVAVAYKHVNEEPARPSTLTPGIPAGLEAAVLRAMAKEPAERFGSAAEMGRTLEDAAEPQTAPTDPVATAPVPRNGDTAILPVASPPERPLSRRRPVALAAALAVALVGVAFLALQGAVGPSGETDGKTAARQPLPESSRQSSVPKALAALTEVVADGLTAGEVDGNPADEILQLAEEAMRGYLEGDLAAALDDLEAAHATTNEALAGGEITSPERAAQIHAAINGLAAAMRATAPAPSPTPSAEEGDDKDGDGAPAEPPGLEQGKGKAKGHKKKD